MATGKSTARNCKCEISPEDKLAIVALNIEENQNQDFLERAFGLYESAGMAALFDRVSRKLGTRESREVNDTLARFVASVLEAAKRCGTA